MGLIALPQRFLAQPQYPAPIDWGNPLTRGIKRAAKLTGIVPVDALGTRITYGTTSVGPSVSTGGKGYLFSGDTTGALSFPLWANSTSEATLVIRQRRASLGYTAWLELGSSADVDHFPYGSTIYCDAFWNGRWINGVNPPAGKDIQVDHVIVLSVKDGAQNAYWDGQLWVSTSYTGGFTLPVTGYIGGNSGSFAGFDGWVYEYLLYDRALSAVEAKSLSQNIHQVWKAPARRLWVVTSSGISLIGSASTQANAAGTGAITQTHVLVGPNSAQANPVGVAAITQTHILVGANSSQDNALSTGSISGGVTLTVAPVTQGNSASSGAISETHALAITASTQVNSSTAVAVTQVHALAAANATQANLGGTGAISLSTGNLIAAPSTQINVSGSGAISLVGIVPDAFLNAIASAAGLKKPGIPADTVAWLRTLLEIMLGRRGNAITVPAQQNLTFSSTPTKAECEALYAYVNSIQSALADLINRFDT